MNYNRITFLIFDIPFAFFFFFTLVGNLYFILIQWKTVGKQADVPWDLMENQRFCMRRANVCVLGFWKCATHWGKQYLRSHWNWIGVQIPQNPSENGMKKSSGVTYNLDREQGHRFNIQYYCSCLRINILRYCPRRNFRKQYLNK